MTNSESRAYTSPELIEYGEVGQLTEMGYPGGESDGFPGGGATGGEFPGEGGPWS